MSEMVWSIGDVVLIGAALVFIALGLGFLVGNEYGRRASLNEEAER